MKESLETIEFEAMLLSRQLAPIRRSVEGRPNLDRSAYTLLARLIAQGPMSIGQLSDAFGLDASTLNRQTAAMTREGLVERIPDPDGGLARKFLPTTEGRRRLLAERRANVKGLGRVVEDWSEADVERLAELLRRLNQEVEKRDGKPWPRQPSRVRS